MIVQELTEYTDDNDSKGDPMTYVHIVGLKHKYLSILP